MDRVKIVLVACLVATLALAGCAASDDESTGDSRSEISTDITVDENESADVDDNETDTNETVLS